MGILGAVEKNDLQLSGLKGKVESMDNGHIAQFFTDKGYLDWEEYECGKRERANRYYDRDEQGRLVYIKDEGTDTYTTFTYDKTGKLAEKKIETVENTTILKYSYNPKGENTWTKYYDTAGKQTKATENSFNPKGCKVKTTEYDATNTITEIYEYAYDDFMNIVEEKHYTANGVLDSKSTYKYDNKNRKVESINYDYTDGESIEKINLAYNVQGDLAELVHYYSGWENPLISKYTYTYDKMGNWISQEEMSLDSDYTDTLERSIEYY
jgi:YD repeat-containing protein